MAWRSPPDRQKHGLIDHVELPGSYSVGFKGRTQKGVPEADIDGVWTSSLDGGG